MKLTETQIARIHSQVGAEPIPESTPVQSDLEAHFGTHTFYVDSAGLYVWEAVDAADVDAAEAAQAEAVAIKVASWANEERTILEKHEPQVVGKTVLFPSLH